MCSCSRTPMPPTWLTSLVMELGAGTPIGPILVGAAATAHVLVPAATTRSVVNVSAVAAVEVQARIDYANSITKA